MKNNNPMISGKNLMIEKVRDEDKYIIRYYDDNHINSFSFTLNGEEMKTLIILAKTIVDK